MKKYLFIAIAAMCSIFFACADNDRIITFDQIPETAKATVQKYLGAENIAFVKLDDELFGDKYEVRFMDGKEMVFEKDGELRKVDYQFEAVPDELVPATVREQINASFPNTFIVEWGKDDWGWKAELNNKLDVKFSRSLQLEGIDD